MSPFQSSMRATGRSVPRLRPGIPSAAEAAWYTRVHRPRHPASATSTGSWCARRRADSAGGSERAIGPPRRPQRPSRRWRRCTGGLADPEPEPRRPLRRRSASAASRLRAMASPSGRSDASTPASPNRSRTASPAARGGTRRAGPHRTAEALREQRADRAGQHVPGPAAGEGRVLERAPPPTAPVRRRDDRSRALEHDDLAPGRGRATVAATRASSSSPRSPSASGSRPLPARSRRNSPTCGRQDGRPRDRPPTTPRAWPASGAPRRRGRAVADRSPARRGAGGRARPSPGRVAAGPDDDRVVLVVEDAGERRLGVDLLDVVLGQRHRRRLDDLGREQRLERLGDGEGHEPDPGPAGGRQTSRAAPA